MFLGIGRRGALADEFLVVVEAAKHLAGELVRDVGQVLESVVEGGDDEGVVVGEGAFGEVEAHAAGVLQHDAGVSCSRWVDDDGREGILQQRVDAVVGQEGRA